MTVSRVVVALNFCSHDEMRKRVAIIADYIESGHVQVISNGDAFLMARLVDQPEDDDLPPLMLPAEFDA